MPKKRNKRARAFWDQNKNDRSRFFLHLVVISQINKVGTGDPDRKGILGVTDINFSVGSIQSVSIVEVSVFPTVGLKMNLDLSRIGKREKQE